MGLISIVVLVLFYLFFNTGIFISVDEDELKETDDQSAFNSNKDTVVKNTTEYSSTKAEYTYSAKDKTGGDSNNSNIPAPTRMSLDDFKKDFPKVMQTSVIDKYGSMILSASEIWGIDPYFIATIIFNESTGHANANNGAKNPRNQCMGLMQVNWSQVKNNKIMDLAIDKSYKFTPATGEVPLYDPWTGIMYGCYVLRAKYASTGGNLLLALRNFQGYADHTWAYYANLKMYTKMHKGIQENYHGDTKPWWVKKDGYVYYYDWKTATETKGSKYDVKK